jgi:hypothetical protein
MRPKRRNERRNTGPTNERHDYVNAICGMDFGQNLATNARFARRVREQRGIEQRNQRVLNRLSTPIRKVPDDASEDFALGDRSFLIQGTSGRRRTDEVDDLACELSTAHRSPILADGFDGALNHSSNMKRNPVRSLRCAKGIPHGFEASAQFTKLSFDGFRNQQFV